MVQYRLINIEKKREELQFILCAKLNIDFSSQKYHFHVNKNNPSKRDYFSTVQTALSTALFLSVCDQRNVEFQTI